MSKVSYHTVRKAWRRERVKNQLGFSRENRKAPANSSDFTQRDKRRFRRSFIKRHREKHYCPTGKNIPINKLGESRVRCKRSETAAFLNAFKLSVFTHFIYFG